MKLSSHAFCSHIWSIPCLFMKTFLHIHQRRLLWKDQCCALCLQSSVSETLDSTDSTDARRRDMIYTIEDTPHWYLCVFLGLQVSYQWNYNQSSVSFVSMIYWVVLGYTTKIIYEKKFVYFQNFDQCLQQSDSHLIPEVFLMSPFSGRAWSRVSHAVKGN